MIFVISGPSGSGKSTVTEGAINGDPLTRRSVSCTTRSRRMGEVDGVDYHFISREEFLGKASQGKFVEWEEIYGELYGTLYSELERTEDGKDVVLVIDYKGANSVKKKFPNSRMIFILPPSFSELGRRLVARGQETREEIALRLAVAVREIEQARSFDYWIENDKIHSATGALISLFSILRHGNVPVYGFKDLPTLKRVVATLPSRV